MKNLCSLLCFVLLLQTGCFGSDDTQDFQRYLASIFYFSSRRLVPENPQNDGDIFFTAALGQQGSNTLTNLTGSSDTGDADDHLCLLDFVRGRAFFMSQRTDLGNAAGDLDIFVVPSLGGVIANLTDDEINVGDDFCNDIHAASGDLIFTSNREDQGHTDPDIYRRAIVLDEEGNLAPGTLTNLTNLPDDGSGFFEFYAERFELLVDDTLLFTSQRPNADQNNVGNCNFAMHIFSIDLTNESLPFVNLTQKGSENSCLPGGLAPPTTDHLCGVVRDVDGFTGVPYLSRVVFTSRQDAGDNSGNQFQVDDDVFSVDPSHPNVLVNLTDGASGDSDDFCERLVTRVQEGESSENFVALFRSQRTATGIRSQLGQWSQSVNSMQDYDLFITDLPSSSTQNIVEDLTDGSSGDNDDKVAGLCGSTIIFESTRSDLESNPDGDIDLYAVDVYSASILPLSNNPDGGSGRDQVDCFLGCDVTLGSVYFASLRLAPANDHGPTPDSDIFRVRFRDGFFNLKDRDQVSIENLTDISEGDSYDFADPNFFSGGACNFASTNVLESQVDEFSSASMLGFFLKPLIQDDFAFGINANNTMLFTSLREDPVNLLSDVDIFSMDLPFSQDTPVISTIINRTDANTNESDLATDDDADDGLEGFVTPFSGPLN